MPKINHNNTDFDSYNKLMQQRNQLLKKKAEISRKNNQMNNLRNWIDTVPDEYKKADLRLFRKGLSIGVLSLLRKHKMPRRLVIHGLANAGKTFYLYGLLKLYIYQGLVTPAEVKITGIREAADATMGGFQKQAWRDNFFDSNAKLFVIRGTSREFTELGIRGSDRFWGEFTQFVNEIHASVIILYEDNLREEKTFTNGTANKVWFPNLTNRNNLVASLLTQELIQIHITRKDHREIST